MPFLEPFTPDMLDGHNGYFTKWLAELGRTREEVVDISITVYALDVPSYAPQSLIPRSRGIRDTYTVTLTFIDRSFEERHERWSEQKLGMPLYVRSHLLVEKENTDAVAH